MATLVCFHAHPDDEAIATAGVMAKAAADGHRVVLVVATRGECGEVADGFLSDGESLGARREVETAAAAQILGVSRVEFLGYHDSGMMDEATNDRPDCFWQADTEEAAQRLANILADEQADVLTVYDDHGGYGHPDHIQVHRVGVRAGEIAGVPRIYEATMNRDHIRRMLERAADEGMEVPDPPDVGDEATFGSPETAITHGVPVADFVEQKRAAMAAHASQIADDHLFLALPAEQFRELMGQEWFIRRGHSRAPGEPMGEDLFADVS